MNYLQYQTNSLQALDRNTNSNQSANFESSSFIMDSSFDAPEDKKMEVDLDVGIDKIREYTGRINCISMNKSTATIGGGGGWVPGKRLKKKRIKNFRFLRRTKIFLFYSVFSRLQHLSQSFFISANRIHSRLI